MTSLSSYLGSSEENNVRYVPRNRSVLVDSSLSAGRGLGSSRRPGWPSRGRGKKSFMALAQDRALLDLAVGKQLSIERALRAPEAHCEGAK